MIKRGITGELLSFDSIMNGQQIKTSSTVTSAKIGLQSLYANYEEMIEKYKDFDLVKEMISRKDSNLLWVRARAIDADVVNSNGDYFSEEELTKVNDYQGKKLPAYKTFEGCPIYTNHKNDDIEEAKGMIVYAEWDDDEKCVFCVFFIDEDAYPELAHGIKQGYIHDVSMGCTVELGICSICGNRATTEKDYCDCLKKYKSKTHPSGKKAYESNFGLKFIELSAVGDGAFESCEVIELYDKEEVIYKSQTIVKAALALNKTMSKVAVSKNKYDRAEIEENLKTFYLLNGTLIKCARNAGNLVGGQLLGSGTAQNATVVKILQGLGIDPGSSLNILDLVNLALNFLEVAVLNLFSRKDNIDLAHVAKLTKAMGELQNTLQDMIDDGIEAGTSNQNPMFPGAQQSQPPAQQQQPQPEAAAQPPVNNVPPMQTQQTVFEPSVGTMISPFSQQPYVMPIGGGVSAGNIKKRIVWAAAGNVDDYEEIIFDKQNKFENFIFALENLRLACNIAEKNSNKDMLEYPQKNKTASSGDKNYMDYFKKIAKDAKNANTVALAIDVKIDDQKGNRVVLSTDKGISGFHNGKLTNWTPVLTDSQIVQMENGDGVKTASELLSDFSNVIKTAYDNNSIDVLMTLNENISSDHEHNEEPIVSGVNKIHSSNENDGMQTRLNVKRTDGSTNENYNDMLESKRTSALVRIVTELSKDAQKNLGSEPLELMINPSMEFSKVSGKKIVRNVLASIATTCEKTNSSPQNVIEFLSFCASHKDFPVALRIARLGTDYRKYNALMSKTAQVLDDNTMDEPMGEPMGDDAVGTEILPVEETAVKDIADNVDSDATEGDIIAALTVIKDNFTEAVSQLDKILDNTAPEDNKMDEMKDALSDDMDDDEDINADAMKGAVTGLSLSGDDMNASGEDIVDTVNNIPADVMAAKINDFRKLSASKKAVASKTDLTGNVLKWLADVAVENNIDTDRITLAAKLLCSYRNSAVNILNKSIKTSKIKVTDETFHGTTIEATLEEIGIDVQDASFNSKFRDIAVDILAQNGYEVDPTTFSLTDIQVTEDGMVCGKVSSRAVKTFTPSYNPNDLDYVDEDRNDVVSDESVLSDAVVLDEASPAIDQDASKMIMSNNAKDNARIARIKNVIKIAQGLGLPGAPQPMAGGGGAAAGMGGDAAGQIPSMDAGIPNAANEMGVSSLTGASPQMDDASINESPEPGTKSPWGTVCPQCGSKDVDVANGTGSCNSCNAQLEFKFIVEVLPSDDKNAPDDASMENIEAPMPADMAMPPAATQPMPNAGNDMGMGGMQQAAGNNRILIKGVYKTTADVYAGATSDEFNKRTAMKLPVGLVCPGCGSREASKRGNNTFCYECDTISHSSVKRIDGEPGMLEASIIWMN